MGEKKWELRVSKVHFCNTGVSAEYLDRPCPAGQEPAPPFIASSSL